MSRAALVKNIRDFFLQRDVLEVETPVLSTAGSTEVHIQHFVTQPCASQPAYRLNSSPELAMKRLLAAGSGDIYQIGKVFRANEQGRRHQSEFTMLEWYRLGFDLNALMTEVELLLNELCPTYFTQARVTLSYTQAFEQYAGLNPLTCALSELKTCYEEKTKHSVPDIAERQALLDLLMSTIVEPQFPARRITFVTEYPAAQASLARLNSQNPLVAERFEVFAGGLELGNGFHELSDATEQRERMQQELAYRKAHQLDEVQLDERLLAALEHGLPECSGVAMGVDRLCMLALDKPSIEQVISFTLEQS
jgi:lysyl-tRNA synthetase class 2